MKRLTKLANKFKTDKGTEYSYAHGYTEYYDEYFSKYENPVILELGVDKGAAEKMLNTFYDGNCEIYCADIEDKSSLFENYSNIHFFQCDLSKRENVKNLIKQFNGIKFDIIIDDASHKWEDQLICLAQFCKLLKEDGIYVLEDLHTVFCSNIFGQNKHFTQSPLSFLLFFNLNDFLTDEEWNYLFVNVENVLTFNLYNSRIDGRSITSIITFKKNFNEKNR